MDDLGEKTNVAAHSMDRVRKIDMSGEAIFRRLETVSQLNELCRMLRESTPIVPEAEVTTDA